MCQVLDELVPIQRVGLAKYEELISFVEDRAGHDTRYAVDISKINKEMSWFPRESFGTGIRKTVEWYLENSDWCDRVRSGEYSNVIGNP